jgi:serine/threonine protein kinase
MGLMALSARDWLAGAALGSRFAEVRLLRAGSRFTIYEARERSAQRLVALKVPDESAGSWLHDVLRDEGEVLSAIGTHPHVIRCYERLELPDGRPALLLEHCRGTLHDALRGDQPVAPEAVAVGIKVAGALETAHRYGVIHCDVRPHNLFRTESGEPALAGFDAAARKDATEPRPPLHRLTAHTAPELLEGEPPTTASDVYGLAATLYELVAGRAAFRAYAGESPASVIVRVLSNPVQRIKAQQVPLELSDLLTWCLAPAPADRPPSPAWIAEELGRIARRQGWPRTRMIAS